MSKFKMYNLQLIPCGIIVVAMLSYNLYYYDNLLKQIEINLWAIAMLLVNILVQIIATNTIYRKANPPSQLGINIGNPKMIVKHSELRRADYSEFRSVCPCCKEPGLFVKRQQDTFNLLSRDRCVFCCQEFEYSYIEDNKSIIL